MTVTEILKSLCLANGVAGKGEIAEKAMEFLRPFTDKQWQDSMGNVLAVKQGTACELPPILLEAHMDEVGFLVTHIDDLGFIHVGCAGGVDNRVLSAQVMNIYADEVLQGTFCSVPPHLSAKNGENALPEIEERGIDCGLCAEQVKKKVPLGTRVGFAPDFVQLSGKNVSSKALDNRAGMTAVLYALSLLKEIKRTVAVAFCVQEELGCRGAAVATRQIKPAMAICTDVSFGYTPDAKSYQCGKMGEGAMVGISPILDSALSDNLLSLANDNGLAVQTEVMTSTTGTDADVISIVNEGIPTALLSIPLRYMHTPVETVNIDDIVSVGTLMAKLIEQEGD